MKREDFLHKALYTHFHKKNLSNLGICKFSCRPADNKDDDISKKKDFFVMFLILS